MPENHFRSMEVSHNKSDVTNRFATAILYWLSVHVLSVTPTSDRIEVIRDFRSLKNGGNPFPVDGGNAEQK
jgi:hypothetical protein